MSKILNGIGVVCTTIVAVEVALFVLAGEIKKADKDGTPTIIWQGLWRNK